jgi:hypothetical protein
MFVRKLLMDWMVADVELVAQQNEWWIDAAASPDEEFKSHMIVRDLTSQQEYEFGRRNALRALEGQNSLPRFVRRPSYRWPVAEAIPPAFEVPDMFQSSSSPSDKSRPILKTLRGVEPLLGDKRTARRLPAAMRRPSSTGRSLAVREERSNAP